MCTFDSQSVKFMSALLVNARYNVPKAEYETVYLREHAAYHENKGGAAVFLW